MAPPPPSPAPQPLNVLVVGANGYLGSAVCRAFLRDAGPPPLFFRVFGLVRREATAPALAADEIIPIVGSLDEPEALTRLVLSHAPTWDVIVVCTEPSKLDPVAEEKHWADVLALVRGLSKSSASQDKPVRPMVLWSSGCKDYGTTQLHGDPELAPHTETSPLVPHPLVMGRMNGAVNAVEASQADGGFDAAIVRATPLFGYSGSYYGAAFDYMDAYVATVKGSGGEGDGVLKIASHEGTVMHGVHIDDCGDAYVALARTALEVPSQQQGLIEAGRAAVAGQTFNISGRRYETLKDVAGALAAEYGFTNGARLGVSVGELPGALGSMDTGLVFGYSQWVASDKIRRVTDWSDRRPLFHENVGVFRVAYEAARVGGNDNVAKTRQRMAGNWGDLKT